MAESDVRSRESVGQRVFTEKLFAIAGAELLNLTNHSLRNQTFGRPLSVELAPRH